MILRKEMSLRLRILNGLADDGILVENFGMKIIFRQSIEFIGARWLKSTPDLQ